jgi:hypothetical protein
VLFNVYAFVWHSEPPVPSIADGFYLAGYPFLTAAQTAIERQLPGSGLGLYISRAIAEAHDGNLTVSSRVGEGTTFRFEVPLAA